MFFSETISLLVVRSLVPCSPVSFSQTILPLLTNTHAPSHASCPLADLLEPFCLTKLVLGVGSQVSWKQSREEGPARPPGAPLHALSQRHGKPHPRPGARNGNSGTQTSWYFEKAGFDQETEKTRSGLFRKKVSRGEGEWTESALRERAKRPPRRVAPRLLPDPRRMTHASQNRGMGALGGHSGLQLAVTS